MATPILDAVGRPFVGPDGNPTRDVVTCPGCGTDTTMDDVQTCSGCPICDVTEEEF